VVNIISKPTTLALGTSAKGSAGDNNHRRWRFAHGALQHTFSVWGEKDDGYDLNFEKDDRHDSQDITKARYVSQFSPNNKSTLNFTAGYAFADLDVEYVDSRQTSYPDKEQKDLFLVADYRVNTSNHSDWRFLTSFYGSDQQQDWNTCYENILYTDEIAQLYAANPGYVDVLRKGAIPSGGTQEDNQLLASVLFKAASLGEGAFSLNCGNLNQDLTDSSFRLEAQNTWTNEAGFMSVAGLGVNFITAESETFFDGTEDARTEYVFYNAQYALRSLTFNGGGMLEHSSHLDDPTDLSFRVATNWHLSSENTLRVAYSNASRTPDLFETDQKWSFTARNLEEPVDGSDTRKILGYYPANANHRSEEIDSFEVAYLFNRPASGLYFQARYFRDDLKNLNSSRINFFNTVTPEPGKSTLKGTEIELRYSPTSATLVGFGYAYLDTDTSAVEERDLNYRHSGHIYGSHAVNDVLRVSLAYYGSDNLSSPSYDKFDFSLIFNLQKNLTADVVLSKQTTEQQFIASNNFIVRNTYKDATAVIVGIEYVF
jgi:iron complex outermembrane receptor protein